MRFNSGLIHAVDLSGDRKHELSCIMAEAHTHLQRAAKERYGKPNIRQLRTDWRAQRCDLKSDRQARRSMQNLERIEHEVIAGYIRIGYRLCRAFYYVHSAFGSFSMDDFVQESAMAIFDAIYAFDGRAKFSTFCYKSIKNRLIDFVRTDRMFSKISREIILHHTHVVRLIQAHPELTFDAALAFYQRQRVCKGLCPLGKNELANIKSSYHVTKVVRRDMEDFLLVQNSEDDLSEDVEELRAAINSDVLTDDERTMVNRFLSGEDGWQSKLAREHGVSRAAIFLRWKKTQDKLRRKLDKKAA